MIAPLLFVVSLVSTGWALASEAPRDPGTYFFNDSFGDFEEELANARQSGKKGILLMFEMDECPFCHRMKMTVLNQPDVQEYFREHFLIFPVDIEGDIEVTDFQGRVTTMKDFAFQQYRVRATPVFAFFDLDGGYIKPARFTGATRDKEEFLLLGRYVVEGAYKDQPFARYKRAAR
jgi:thioredoxin-related protein